MEPITIIACVALPILGAGLYYVSTSGKRARIEAARLEAVKGRAAQRVAERSFADTESSSYHTAIEFSTAITATEIDNRVDGYGDLSEEQKKTIGLIFDGFTPGATHDSVKIQGTSAQRRAGVPWATSIFNDNLDDLVGPEDRWLNA